MTFTGVLRSILLFSLLTLLSGLLTSVMPVFPAFVLAWWTVGVAAVANFTVAFVWTIELAAGDDPLPLTTSLLKCKLVVREVEDHPGDVHAVHLAFCPRFSSGCRLHLAFLGHHAAGRSVSVSDCDSDLLYYRWCPPPACWPRPSSTSCPSLPAGWWPRAGSVRRGQSWPAGPGETTGRWGRSR